MTKIAILCPTRGRPEQFRRMVDSVNRTAKNAVVFSGSNGNDDYVQHHFPIDYPTCMMWNELCAIALLNKDTKLFMLGADDTIFSTPCWDEALIDHYSNLENKIHVYAFQDSRDPDGTPHPVVTREWIDALGYFMPPIFLHWYVDTWTVELAKRCGVFTHMKDYLLVHDKPSDKGMADETHSRIRKMGWHERDKYVWDKVQ